MKSFDKNEIWSGVLESVKVSVSDAIYSTWFIQTHLAEIKEVDTRYLVEIGCNSSFVKSTLESRYHALLQETLTSILKSPCDLIFIVKVKKVETKNEPETPLFATNTEDKSEKLNESNIRRSLTFENFAVSSSNQMAWAAADAVSNEPGSAYNPLFIWGGVGVGKTHLMNAVGYSFVEKSSTRVLFCTGEDFTNDIVEGIRRKSTQEVRKKYRKVKVLLIDDIQFIAGKDAVQEEFFHTFNKLVNSGSQIIMTSDRPPSEISKLEERLRSRFEAGLIVDVGEPDFELRCAIVQIKAQEKNLEIPMDLVQMIAGNLDTARKIEGFLILLSSEVKLKKQVVNVNLIESLLSKSGVITSTENTKSIKPLDVVSAVSDYYSIGKRNLLGTSRSRPVARPRQICMYLLRTHLGLPLQEVGRLIGGRDHTTVMHAVDKITILASTDVQTREDIRGIKNLI